ncbi:MAG: hypothetical protein ABSC94_21805 [Polyangiaceae bacterium]|jgi:phosphomevalonate kinase
MRVRAPGKLVLTGAYAVLDGAPAIVAAVDRYAVADPSRVADCPIAEVRAALGDEAAPEVDLRALQDPAGRKLGLGSSAAGVVAALAAKELARGGDPRDPRVRDRIFRSARAAHARVQSGGSGLDVAASVYGGVLRYQLVANEPAIRPVKLARELVVATFASAQSARTSELRARVDAARSRYPAESAAMGRAMAETSLHAAASLEAGDSLGYIRNANAFGTLLARLGSLADAPIVPPDWTELARQALAAGGAFLPSGAGGGDVAVWLGVDRPSASFVARAAILGLVSLPVSIDYGGVRPEPPIA